MSDYTESADGQEALQQAERDVLEVQQLQAELTRLRAAVTALADELAALADDYDVDVIDNMRRLAARLRDALEPR